MMRKNITIRLAAKCLMLLFAALLAHLPASADILLSETFPDENLRNFLRSKAYEQNLSTFEAAQALPTNNWNYWAPTGDYVSNPLDKDLWTDKDIRNVKKLDLSAESDKVSNLTGIDRLNYLRQFNCSGHEIAGQLVFNNNFETLDLSNNQITSISGYFSAQTLNLSNNQLTGTLDLSGCSQLTTVDVSNNQITDIKFYYQQYYNNSGTYQYTYYAENLTNINISGNQIGKSQLKDMIHRLVNRYGSTTGTLKAINAGNDGNEVDGAIACLASNRGWNVTYADGSAYQATIRLEDVIPDANFCLYLRKSAWGFNSNFFNTAKNNGLWTESGTYDSNPLDKDEWTIKEFQLIKTLNLNGKSAKVSSLEGIELFRSLNTLKCRDHLLSGTVDLSALERLMEVELHNNQISELLLSPEASILTSIKLYNNRMSIQSFSQLLNNIYNRTNNTTKGKLYAIDYDNGDNNEIDLKCINVGKMRGWNVLDASGNPCSVSASLEEIFEDENLIAYLRQKAYSDNQSVFTTAQSNGEWSPNGNYTGNPLNKVAWTVDEFLLIESLKLNGWQPTISSLAGIEHLLNLKTLICPGHNLSKVDLQDLYSLETINLSNNQISELKVPQYGRVRYWNSSSTDLGDKGFITELRIDNNKLTRSALINIAAEISVRTMEGESYKRGYVYISRDDNNLSDYAVYAFKHKNYNLLYDDGTSCQYVESFNLNTVIPDENFRAYLKEQAFYDNKDYIDQYLENAMSNADYATFENYAEYNNYYNGNIDNPLNKDVWTQQDVHLLKYMDLSKWNEANYGNDSKLISNLTGIERFVRLEQLIVDGHKLSSLDVSGMASLRILRCHDQKSDGKLTQLIMNNCDSLWQIYCDNNELKRFDLSTVPNLKMLRCNNNPLEELNLEHNAKLDYLDCYNCTLDELDVTHNPVLRILYCYETRDNEVDGVAATRRGKLTELDLSKNPELYELRCSNNPLPELDLKNNPKLEILFCNSINFSNGSLQQSLQYVPRLRQLSCYNDTLETLDVSQNTKLELLVCYRNQLKRLDVSKNLALKTLNCGENQWHEEDGETNCDERRVPLPYGGNKITTLDVSKNVNLEKLYCAQNWLTELDLRGLYNLNDLNYAEQIRRIRAENALVHVKEGNNYVAKNLFYMRMDKNRNDNGLILQDRIRPTDWDEIANFEIDLVDMTSWTNSTLFHGTRTSKPTHRAATTDDLEKDYVIGDILVLNPDVETDEVAEGKVTYKYDVRKEADAPAEDKHTEFTLLWYTEPQVITGVEQITAGKAVAAVTYYNPSGMASNKPFDGLNIVVTVHADGTVTSHKAIF